MSAPPARFVTPAGTVRAQTRSEAAAFAHTLVAARAALEEWLVDMRSEPIEVWVQQELSAGWFTRPDYTAQAFTVQRRGRPARVHVRSSDGTRHLAHEIVHAILGPDWSPLPQAVEEGLCDYLALRFAPDDELVGSRLRSACLEGWDEFKLIWKERDGQDESESHRLWAQGTGTRHFGELELDVWGVLALNGKRPFRGLDEKTIEFAYGVGYFLAARAIERNGVASLHAACARARAADAETVPGIWIFEAADLDPEELATETARARAEHLERSALDDPIFFSTLAELRARAPEAATPPEFLARFQPALAVGAGEPRPLAELPGFAVWLALHWEELAPPCEP